MGKLFNSAGRALSRASEFVTFWTLVPSGTLAVISAYFSTGVGWINAFGAWGWFSSGLITFLVSSFSFAAISRTKLWRLDAKNRARIQGDSSLFDPMARVYENKRLYLRDLAPVGRQMVVNKKFIGCEIIGPGTAILGTRSSEQKPWPTMKDCNTFDVDCIQIDPSSNSRLAISFQDRDFDSCNFYHMTLLFWTRENGTLN